MINDDLITFLETIKADIINSMQANGSSASGQTAKQLTVVKDGENLQLQLPGYMQLLETGRGPTQPDSVQGSPPMIQRIQQWCQEMGIPDKAAWAIKKSIDKNGFKGKPGILSVPIGNDNINARLNPALENIGKKVSKKTVEKIRLKKSSHKPR